MIQARDIIAPLLLGAALLAGCADTPDGDLARQCEDGIALAQQELREAEARGLSETWQYTKAVGLISAAAVQSEFGKYPNCIDKVDRARAFIREANQ